MKQLKDYIGQKVCVVVNSLEETEEILKLFYICMPKEARHSATAMYKPNEKEGGKHGLCLWQGNISHTDVEWFIQNNSQLIFAHEFLQEIYEIY